MAAQETHKIHALRVPQIPTVKGERLLGTFLSEATISIRRVTVDIIFTTPVSL